MVRVLALAACCLVAAAPPPRPAVPQEVEPPSPHVDLKPKANQKLLDDFGGGRFEGNSLEGLPRGVKTLGGVKFRVGDGLIRLGNAKVNDKHQKVEGLRVGRRARKLHFLHATEHNAAVGTVIAKYVVHYADRTKAEVEVAYGRDVMDWWSYPNQADPTAGKLAWEGENKAAKTYDAKIKLYLMTWKNPHPKKEVVSIDFVATATDTDVVPFCVAITAEK